MKACIYFVLALVLANTEQIIGDTETRGRLYQSADAVANQFPSLARIATKWGEGYFLCSGSLISPEYILTAAHCLDDAGARPSAAYIFMGTHVIKGEGQVSVTIEPILDNVNVFVHESYNNTGFINDDIGLIKVPAMTLSNSIKCAVMYNVPQVFQDQEMVVAGWGATDDKFSYPSNAKWNTFVGKLTSFCGTQLNWTMSAGQLCLHNPHASACTGDSGGPSYHNGKLTGVGSFITDQGCSAGYPMVYTDIYYYRDWLARKMN